MIDIVLRAASPDFDVDGFLERFPGLRPDSRWRVGDRQLRSRPPMREAGFRKAIGGADAWDDVWPLARAALVELRAVLELLARDNIPRELDIGVLAMGPETNVRQLSLAPDDLDFLREMGLSLTVTVYPVDEEKVRAMSE